MRNNQRQYITDIRNVHLVGRGMVRDAS